MAAAEALAKDADVRGAGATEVAAAAGVAAVEAAGWGEGRSQNSRGRMYRMRPLHQAHRPDIRR